MQQPPIFRMGRTAAFLITTLLSLTWIVLLSIIAFARWDTTQDSIKPFIVVIILTNLLTVIVLPVLIILQFRPWLDAARMFLLLTAHIGVGIAYVLWFHRFRCTFQDVDDVMCQTINTNILVLIWVIPVLLLFYSACLAMLVHIRRRTSSTATNAGVPSIERKAIGGVPSSPSNPHFAIRTQRLSAMPLPSPVLPSPLSKAWENGRPRHPSCIAVGIPSFQGSSADDALLRRASQSPSTWTPQSLQFAPLSLPPSSSIPVQRSRASLPAPPKRASMPMPQAVPRPGRQSMPRFVGNRTSHLSELVAMTRSGAEAASCDASEPVEAQPATRKKLAKVSKVYSQVYINAI